MRISDVQHQPRAHRIIRRALAGQRMPHAYLFAGPDGVGKEMFALALAQTLLCASPARVSAGEDAEEQIDACGECQDCRLAEAGTHPDLFLIYRQLAKQHPDAQIRKRLAVDLSVGVIRHFLIVQAGHRPSRGRAKIFIIREAERMSAGAQNALLKTLEEPPPDTFLILLAPSLDRMLQTTRSRCQHVPFQALPVAFVRERLAALRPAAEATAVNYAAHHSGGSLGQGLRVLDDGIYPMKREWGGRLVELASAGSAFAAHALAGPMDTDARTLAKLLVERDPDISDTDAARNGVRALLAVLGDFYLDALRRAEGAPLPPINEDQPEVIEALARSSSAAGLAGALRELQTTDANLARNANIQLTLEALFIRLAGKSPGSRTATGAS